MSDYRYLLNPVWGVQGVGVSRGQNPGQGQFVALSPAAPTSVEVWGVPVVTGVVHWATGSVVTSGVLSSASLVSTTAVGNYGWPAGHNGGMVTAPYTG
jgi:hypothetical protein